MAEHIGIAHPQVGVFVLLVARHLVHHGAFQMHHFIVGQGQYVLLIFIVAHGKGHGVVAALAVQGIQLHVLAEIVHPSHVPLEGEAKPLPADVPGHIGPGGGLLGDSDEARVGAPHHGIQMLEELDGLQVLVAAVFVGHPLTVLLAVIQVKHGRHSVYPYTVYVELPQPVQHIGDQEILHLGLAVVENLGAPVRVGPQAGVGMLEDALSVKLRQAMGIRGEMGGHPVQDHAHAHPVELVHQVHEILRRAVPGGGRVVARHLIAPGAVVRMLQDAHQLHMGVFHLL